MLSRHIDAIVINAGDGTHEHPTQALLDAFSLRAQFGDLTGKHIGIVGDITHSRVALSNILCLKQLGAKVTLCGPPTLIPKHISALDVNIETNIDKLLPQLDAVMMLRIQQERMAKAYFPDLREYANQFGLNEERLAKLDAPLTILHPGPINRGVELTSAVADSDRDYTEPSDQWRCRTHGGVVSVGTRCRFHTH